jgi:serine/threonine-protein kinase
MAATDQPSRGFSVPLALKFFIGSAFLISLAVATAVIVTYIQGNRIAARAVDTALSTSTAVQKEIEQSRLNQLQLILQQIAADPSTVKYVSQASGTTNNLPGLSESSDTDTKSIPDLLKERQTQFHFDLGIALDGKGIVLGRSDQTEAFQESLANDPLVKPAIEKLTPFSGYWRNGDKLYQAAIVPLGQDQDLVGFLLLAQRVNDELSGEMAKISGAQIAFWLPQDKQLRLVASSLTEADAKALQDAVNAQAPDMAAAVSAGQPIPRLTLQFAGQKWASQLAPTAATGEGSLGAVLALASTDKIIASYRDILNWVLIGGALSIVIALLLSYVLAKGILRPVRTMAEVAEQAAAGNYRAQIGLSGNDELARLSRAFDSLLSDLREKSDIEGYVSNLSRFLPDPARESASPASKPAASPTPTPPRRDTLSLLGLEFRDLANVAPSASPEEAADKLAHASALIESAAPGAVVRQSTGSQFVVGFGGESRAVASLRALAQVRHRFRRRGARIESEQRSGGARRGKSAFGSPTAGSGTRTNAAHASGR